MFRKKRVLVAGTGLVGMPLIRQLLEQGAIVLAVSLDKNPNIPNTEFAQADLTDYQNCLRVCEGVDYVFNLLGIKGPPGMAQKYPVNSFEPMLLFSALLLKAAWANQVGGYLYTSSVGVYKPEEVLREDDVWKTQPSKHDWFPGQAKRIGEVHVEAYRRQYGWNTAIVRPSNIYGPYDNFNPESAMFMAYIIRQFAENQNPIVISGDGNQARDFIHSEDAARGIILAAEKSACPVNLCSGRETTVKEVVDILRRNTKHKGTIIYDTSRPSGDTRRVMDVTKLRSLGFEPKINLEEGIMTTFEWYLRNKM